jgi:hypothetical protein
MLNNDPVRAAATGRWRITFAEELPEGAWRARFLAKAQSTMNGRALDLTFEGTTLEFSCPDLDEPAALGPALRERTRLINALLKETKPAGGA